MSIVGRQLACASMQAIGVVMLMAACATKPPPPTTVAGTIQVSMQANPSASGRPSPLLVRVYELKSAAAFNSADFMSLYQRDQAELAADIVAKDEFMLSPGESKPYAKTLSPDTHFIGVFAAYRDLEHAKWRGIVAIQPAQKQQLTVRAGELAVDASIGR